MIEQLVARVSSTRDCAHFTTPQSPEWAVFNLTWWNSDSLLDWIVPTLTVVAVAAAFQWM